MIKDESTRRNSYHGEFLTSPPPSSSSTSYRRNFFPEDEEELDPSESGKITIMNKWKESILQTNGASMLQLIVEEVQQMNYKPKSLKKDYEIVTNMVNQMYNILSHAFLKVNFHCEVRDIEKTDWSNLCACQKSESGTIGIYFLQCGSGNTNKLANNANNNTNNSSNNTSNNNLIINNNEIIVAKAYTLQDYERTLFVQELASNYFQIRSPKIRYIDRQDNEYSQLQTGIKDLFQPLFGDLYEIGGSLSPKDLFTSKGIMLVEFVQGKPLNHRSKGQRQLIYDDYYEIGKIFLFDLFIRNTDRFPCRKALPRPTVTSILDEGNPGNIMFGVENGVVWSIDPELQINVDNILHDTYAKALESVVKEIIFRQDLDRRYKSIETLFFQIIPSLEDVLPTSLNDAHDWDKCNPLEQEAIAAILNLIRIKLMIDSTILENGPIVLTIPKDNNEKEWREFIRQLTPRVMEDLFEFLEIHTGYSTPYYAYDAFVKGFHDSLQYAIQFKKEYNHPSTPYHQQMKVDLQDTAEKESSINIPFVLDMISVIEPYWDEWNIIGSTTASLSRVESRTLSKNRF